MRPGTTARRVVLAFGAVLALAVPALADVYRPAYLELRQRDEQTYDVLWRVPATGNLRLGVHVRFPQGTLVWTEPRGTYASGVLTERWTVSRPGGLAGGEVVITGLPAGITDVLARVERLDGSTQVERLVPSRPRFMIEAPLTGAGVSRTYLVLGIHHILEGVDHLLFVSALVLVVGNLRRLLVTITAFTLAHSVTLAAATLGLVRVPQAPVEAVIALSIVFVAAEIVRGLEGRAGPHRRAPWVVAFAFGLLHGFGFAGALAEVGLPPRAIPLALVFFNVGVELGQLLFVAGLWAVLMAAARFHQPRPRWVRALPAYAIGSVAMFWVIERTLALAQ